MTRSADREETATRIGRAWIAVACFALATVTVGCENLDFGAKDRQELEVARKNIEKLEEQNAQLRSVVSRQQDQIGLLLKLGEKRLEKIFHVTRIELGRYTGGIDLDGRSGHEGIKVFLRPLDADGGVIKAAGSVKIQFFDLAAPGEKNLIGRYAWGVDEISKYWSSSAFTYHYSFECPWKPAPPTHDKITVRVEFTDYLTGKTFTAQKVCEVKLPPPAVPMSPTTPTPTPPTSPAKTPETNPGG